MNVKTLKLQEQLLKYTMFSYQLDSIVNKLKENTFVKSDFDDILNILDSAIMFNKGQINDYKMLLPTEAYNIILKSIDVNKWNNLEEYLNKLKRLIKKESPSKEDINILNGFITKLKISNDITISKINNKLDEFEWRY